MLALSIIAGTVATAFADELIKNCYTADNAELLDEYINAYGWDKDKMLATTGRSISAKSVDRGNTLQTASRVQMTS